MNILEKDLEEIIYSTELKELEKRGLKLSGKCFRQLKIGNYGISDLVYITKVGHGFDSYIDVNVCELKKDKAGISAFLQAVRYAKGISTYLNNRVFYNYKISITIIGKEIDINSDYIFLTDLVNSYNDRSINSINNYSVSYLFDGIRFKKEEGYDIINKGFKTVNF